MARKHLSLVAGQLSFADVREYERPHKDMKTLLRAIDQLLEQKKAA